MTKVTVTNLNFKVNTLDISSGSYIVTGIDHESAPPIQLTTYQLARRDLAKVVNLNYQPKKITIDGYAKGSDKATLETNIDTLKKYLTGFDNVLTIDYAGSQRSYAFELTGYTSLRKAGQVTLEGYSAELTINAVFGTPPTQTEKVLNSITTRNTLQSFTAVGTYYPEPVYTLNIKTASGLNSIKIYGVDGNYIRIADTFKAGDMVIVDTPNRRVTKTTVTAELYEEDFTGLFPATKLDVNNLQYTFSSVSHSVNITLDWFERYF